MVIHNSSKPLLQIFRHVNYFIVVWNPYWRPFFLGLWYRFATQKKTGQKRLVISILFHRFGTNYRN